MFEEENQIENQVENQEPKIDSEKKTVEPAVVKKRIIARRHRKEEASASPAASAAPAANPVPENTEEYAEAHRLLNFIEIIEPIDPTYIPPASIMREFLGGSTFNY